MTDRPRCADKSKRDTFRKNAGFLTSLERWLLDAADYLDARLSEAVAERDSYRKDAEKLQRDHAALKGDIEVEREGAGYLRTKLTWATKERQAMEKREARCLHDCVHHEGCVLLVGGERRAHSLSCISHISCKPCDCGLVELGEDE